MQVLDTTIANVSIPTIAGDLGVSSDQGTWIITSFAVANGVSVPMTGWLMRRFGVVRTFVASVLLFTIASFLCGIAWSLPVLIFFRIVQGAVSGPMIPGSQALLLALFPESRKGTALAIWSMTTLVAPICGPILGGIISDNFHWSWIFLINVPVGIFAAAVCWTALRQHETPTAKLRMDGVGLGLLILWVGALQVALDQGKNLDWFHSSTIVTLTAVAVIGFAAWIVWEATEENPLVDLSLFKQRNFVFGTIGLTLGYGVFFGTVVITPLWLQTQMGYTATWAGLAAAPSGLTAVLVSPLVGRLISRYDARILASLSFTIFAGSYFLRSGYTTDASFWAIAWPVLVQGVAMGLFFVSLLTILLDGLPPAKVPAASGLSNFARITGSSFATSLATTFWDRREALHQSRLVESLTGFDPAFTQAVGVLQSQGASAAASAAAVTRQVIGQAYLLSTIELFTLSGAMVLLLVPMIWFARRPAGGAVAAGGD
jgi:DHA2 family multidrug resistance protein